MWPFVRPEGPEGEREPHVRAGLHSCRTYKWWSVARSMRGQSKGCHRGRSPTATPQLPSGTALQSCLCWGQAAFWHLRASMQSPGRAGVSREGTDPRSAHSRRQARRVKSACSRHVTVSAQRKQRQDRAQAGQRQHHRGRRVRRRLPRARGHSLRAAKVGSLAARAQLEPHLWPLLPAAVGAALDRSPRPRLAPGLLAAAPLCYRQRRLPARCQQQVYKVALLGTGAGLQAGSSCSRLELRDRQRRQLLA